MRTARSGLPSICRSRTALVLCRLSTVNTCGEKHTSTKSASSLGETVLAPLWHRPVLNCLAKLGASGNRRLGNGGQPLSTGSAFRLATTRHSHPQKEGRFSTPCDQKAL